MSTEVVSVLHDAFLVIGIAFAGYSVAVNVSFMMLTGLALADITGYRRRLDFAGYDEWFHDPNTQGVSVLMPACNESATIVQSVHAMISLRYPDLEVVVIDDGSRDDTLAKLVAEFDMVEVPLVAGGSLPTVGEVHSTWVSRLGSHNLALVSKANGGKADALNAGINHARKELVCMVDADTLLDPQALLKVARPFADHPGEVVAVGGVVRVANGSRVERGRVTNLRMPRRLLARIQVVEYLRAYLLGRTGWSRLGALILISGAFGVFRRDVLVEVGGLLEGSLGEDFELVMRLHKRLRDQGRDYRIVFVAEPICWTEVPVTVSVLHRQRRRWHRGLWETLWAYRTMAGRPRYGVIGLVALPWHWLFELMAPVLELAGLALIALGAALGVVNLAFFWLFMSVAYVYGILVTLAAMLLEEMGFPKYRRWRDLGAALLASIAENIGYRQLTAWWRAEGWWSSLRGRTLGWGTMTRQGFTSGEEGTDA